ncbi:MAG: hypothetical protein C7B45_13965 [Sulfobacillus acidophilus]|uniref:Uncharacterized protein n=1 Tax=Sulfobacillus acidophilus TaxID=53633 RepID=A0A2T2WEF8_9FIRM|nr:MAG: hypothetical protein C7B45_13965 [Sulfobacillus acidophilus]
MTILRGLVRVVLVALAIWVGQGIVPLSTKTGIWAMVSLGIAAALAAMLLLRYVLPLKNRGSQAMVQFAVTGILIEVYYFLVSRFAYHMAPDTVLALGTAIVSGLFEFAVPDHLLA